jgi:hypothetical protein
MAKPKVRTVSLSFDFTMKRAGDAKGDEAWTTLLKRIQTVLGEKYDVLRLIVDEREGAIAHEPDDKVFEAGWPRGYWESWYEYSGQRAADQEREEIEAAAALVEAEMARQVAEEDAEGAMEDHDLEMIEAAEQAPDEPDPAA